MKGNAEKFYDLIDTQNQPTTTEATPQELSLLQKLEKSENRKHLVEASKENFKKLDQTQKDALHTNTIQHIIEKNTTGHIDEGSLSTYDPIHMDWENATASQRGLGYLATSLGTNTPNPNKVQVQSYIDIAIKSHLTNQGYTEQSDGSFVKKNNDTVQENDDQLLEGKILQPRSIGDDQSPEYLAATGQITPEEYTKLTGKKREIPKVPNKRINVVTGEEIKDSATEHDNDDIAKKLTNAKRKSFEGKILQPRSIGDDQSPEYLAATGQITPEEYTKLTGKKREISKKIKKEGKINSHVIKEKLEQSNFDITTINLPPLKRPEVKGLRRIFGKEKERERLWNTMKQQVISSITNALGDEFIGGQFDSYDSYDFSDRIIKVVDSGIFKNGGKINIIKTIGGYNKNTAKMLHLQHTMTLEQQGNLPHKLTKPFFPTMDILPDLCVKSPSTGRYASFSFVQ